jgi:transposase
MPARYVFLSRYLQNSFPDCRIHVMYEAGFSGFWLHDLLWQDGVECVVTPAHKVTQEKVNLVKTDKIDARRLAKNLENGDYRSCHVPDRELREDRQISRTLTQIQKDIVRTKNRIRRLLDYHGLNEDLPAGAWKTSHYRKVKDLKLSSPLQFCLDVYFMLVEGLEGLRIKLKVELEALCRKDRYRKSVESKKQFPGVGWLSAIRLTLEWGEMSRFMGGKQLASFAGLTSKEYSTGTTIHRGRITRQGNGPVRGWLIQCAWRALSLDPVLLMKFKAVWANSGSKKKAIVAVARKMAVRMRALEIANEPYFLGVVI